MRGGGPGQSRSQQQARQPRSCLFVALSAIGLVVFAVTTLVVASLDALVVAPGEGDKVNMGPGAKSSSRALLQQGPSFWWWLLLLLFAIAFLVFLYDMLSCCRLVNVVPEEW